MNRDALIRELRSYSRKSRLDFDFNPGRGKGGHGTVQVGERFTVVKSGELTKVYVQVVLKQLGLAKDAID